MSEVSSSLPLSQLWFIFQIPPRLATSVYIYFFLTSVLWAWVFPLPPLLLFQKLAPSMRFLRLCSVQIVRANTPTLADSTESLIPALVPTDVLSASGPSK